MGMQSVHWTSIWVTGQPMRLWKASVESGTTEPRLGPGYCWGWKAWQSHQLVYCRDLSNETAEGQSIYSSTEQVNLLTSMDLFAMGTHWWDIFSQSDTDNWADLLKQLRASLGWKENGHSLMAVETWLKHRLPKSIKLENMTNKHKYNTELSLSSATWYKNVPNVSPHLGHDQTLLFLFRFSTCVGDLYVHDVSIY